MESKRATLLFAVINCFLIIYIFFRLVSPQPEQDVPHSSSGKATENIMCGPIAFSLVCKSIGVNISVDEIAKLADIDDKGTSMYALAKAARQLGLKAMGMKISLEQLEHFRKPLIAHLSPNHFIAVHAVDRNSVFFSDQTGEELEMPLQNFLKRWDGYVLVVTR